MAYTRILGIYTITCTVTGMIYVGKSLNIKVRWCRHRYDLRDGIHWNSSMQRDYDAYGIDSFSFKIIEEYELGTSDEYLCEREKYWINKLNTFEQGYNETLGGIGNLGKKFSKEARDRMSEAHKGRTHTEEAKDKISKAKRKRVVANGVEYLGMQTAAKAIGVCTDTIRKRALDPCIEDYYFV